MIFVASSWKNGYYALVVEDLRFNGHEVYDFRNPDEGDHGFAWADIDPEWENWTVEEYIEGLKHPLAESAFSKDMAALTASDILVLVLPCGISSHIEAGYAAGAGARVIVYAPPGVVVKPELAYKVFSGGSVSCLDDLQKVVDQAIDVAKAPKAVTTHNERCAQILTTRALSAVLNLKDVFNKALAKESTLDPSCPPRPTSSRSINIIRGFLDNLLGYLDVAAKWVVSGSKGGEDYKDVVYGNVIGLMNRFVEIVESLRLWLNGRDTPAIRAIAPIVDNFVQNIDHAQAVYERSFEAATAKQEQELDESPFSEPD